MSNVIDMQPCYGLREPRGSVNAVPRSWRRERILTLQDAIASMPNGPKASDLENWPGVLSNSQDRFQAIVADADEGIIVLEPRSVIGYTNHAAEFLLGHDSADLVGEMFGLPLAPSDDPVVVEEAGAYDLSGIISQIADAVKEVDAKVVILDSLGALFYQFQNPGILRREILRITDLLQEMGVTSVMTAERVEEYGPITRFGIEEFALDCVIVCR